MEEEKKNKKYEIDFLTDKENYYLSVQKGAYFEECETLLPKDLALYHVEEITFEEKAPRKEALENFISAMKIPGTNFVYLVLGDENGVHFYYGVASSLASNTDSGLSAYDIGRHIIKTGVEGNFRGSKTSEVPPEKRNEIIASFDLDKMPFQSILEGVPGYNKEDDEFQGVDRLADVMMGDKFAFIIVASPVGYSEIKTIEQDLFNVYDRIIPFAKESIQEGSSVNSAVSKGNSRGVSKNCSQNYGVTHQESISINDNKGDSFNTSVNSSFQYSASESDGGSSSSTSASRNAGGGDSTQSGTTRGHSEGTNVGGSSNLSYGKSEGSTESTNTSFNNGYGTSSSKTIELVNKASQDWIKYFDEVIMPRLDYGMGKGIFVTTSYLLADKKPVLTKLQNTVISLYSGEKGNKVPLRAFDITDRNLQSYLKNFQLPMAKFKKPISQNETVSRSALSQYVNETEHFIIGNWITTNELSVIAGLPRKDVFGLALKEEVEFGLNYNLQLENTDDDDESTEDNKLSIGTLIQSGREINAEVYLDRRNLDKHVFITGVTGSGKTTTCQSLLKNSKLHFMVIEPAKTEYRLLKKEEEYSNLLVFTLGNDSGTPFRLNPFEFFPHESITSRVDMIRASIEAAFEMEAAMPQIIEQAIYACYRDYGWNVSTNENVNYQNRLDAFKDGEFAFPTLGDLVQKIDDVVNEQGFSERLRDDYLGSIKARLNGLLMGSKGLMLNTRRSIDFRDLLKKDVVLELEEIRNGAEKSLVMGFVLTNLMEAIKEDFDGKSKLKHITLVEEAHRLLSKFQPGDSPNKKHGVETFTDMLAEIRKYGESLIVVDQIPNKLTPEILKNTNTKIVHKIFAADDKEAIGNTIVLNEDQKGFLSNLLPGRAILFTQGIDKAIQVQVSVATKKKTTDKSGVKIEELQDAVFDFYCEKYKKGIIPNMQYCKDEKEAKTKIVGLLAQSKEEYLPGMVKFYYEKNGHLPGEEQIEKFKKLLQEKEQIVEVFTFLATKPSTKADERKPEIKDKINKLKEIDNDDYLIYLIAYMYYSKKNEINKRENEKYRLAWKQYIDLFISSEMMSNDDMKNIQDKEL